MSATVLVTGGLGYIGSHTTVELLSSGFNVLIVDNLTNSDAFIIERIEKITGRRPLFFEMDICHTGQLSSVFRVYSIDAVIHFAAYKSVNEAVNLPLKYYNNNLRGLLSVLECMKRYRLTNIVFSSSATVYGKPDQLPVSEDAPLRVSSTAYGSTKQMGEDILQKLADASMVNAIALRYFNPVGAHPSGLIGELPKNVPGNLLPLITRTAIGKRSELTIYGKDYETPDGTCIRDFLHVADLARAHVLACRRLLLSKQMTPFEVFNLGTGKGTSVLQMLREFERVSGRSVPYTISDRRAGDVASVYADCTRAKEHLGWECSYGLEDMVRTAWEWECSLNNVTTTQAK